MSTNTATIILPDDDGHSSRLEALGLSAQELRGALETAYVITSALTSNHPRLARPFNIWSETIASLRDTKAKDGWTKKNDRNYETVRHPQAVCDISAASGTAGTGEGSPLIPRTSSRKGKVTKDVVARNQLTLFPNPTAAEDEEVAPPTWILLHRHDRGAGMIMCELSLPLGMEDDVVVSWAERIILEPIPFESDEANQAIEPPDDGDDPIYIDVPRRPDR